MGGWGDGGTRGQGDKEKLKLFIPVVLTFIPLNLFPPRSLRSLRFFKIGN
jgi:hypothetical protein